MRVRPGSPEEFGRVVEECRRRGLPLVISARPCMECVVFEELLAREGLLDRVVVVDVPAEDWAVDYVLDVLGAPGAPSLVAPDGSVYGGSPLELLEKVREILAGRRGGAAGI